MVVLDVSIVNVALPQMRHDLGLALTAAQWVVNAYTLTFAGFLMLGGRRRRPVRTPPRVPRWPGAVHHCQPDRGLAQSGGWLIAARAAQGLGGAVLAPTSLSLLTSTFTDMTERRRAIGVWSATAQRRRRRVLAGGFSPTCSAGSRCCSSTSRSAS